MVPAMHMLVRNLVLAPHDIDGEIITTLWGRLALHSPRRANHCTIIARGI